MWRYFLAILLPAALVGGQSAPGSGDELVSKVLENCLEMDCVKQNVLGYLDNVLHIQGDVRNTKNMDAAIFKRVSRVLKTHEFRFKVPEAVMEETEIIYNPTSGLDIKTKESENESRGLGLKKKLLFPILLLLKLKMKLLQPLFNVYLFLKASKALILSKLAILIVIGFVAYQLLGKSGMPMAMAMAPVEPPAPLYGPPSSPPPPPQLNSYDPAWEPNNGGPYQRMWTVASDPQNLAYSAYFPGSSGSSSTNRP